MQGELSALDGPLARIGYASAQGIDRVRPTRTKNEKYPSNRVKLFLYDRNESSLAS